MFYPLTAPHHTLPSDHYDSHSSILLPAHMPTLPFIPIGSDKGGGGGNLDGCVHVRARLLPLQPIEVLRQLAKALEHVAQRGRLGIQNLIRGLQGNDHTYNLGGKKMEKRGEKSGKKRGKRGVKGGKKRSNKKQINDTYYVYDARLKKDTNEALFLSTSKWEVGGRGSPPPAPPRSPHPCTSPPQTSPARAS